jgi:parallel beta-helix repeat protein
VPPGTYRERVEITKPLKLVGYGATLEGTSTGQQSWFWVAANDVTIEGFRARNAGQDEPCAQGWGGLQIGGKWKGAVHRFTGRDLDLSDAGCDTVSIQGGSGHVIEDSVIARGGQLCISGSNGSSWRFSRIRVTDCNVDHLDVGNNASAFKVTTLRGLLIEDSEFDSSWGRGIWTDSAMYDVVIRRNRIHHNHWNGIFLESTHGIQVYDNVVWENTRAPEARPWAWGGGITLSSSDHADVHDNVVAWNGAGITVVSQSRTDDAPHVEQYVHDNDIILPDRTYYGTAWVEDIQSGTTTGNYKGILFAAASNNRGSGNRYWVPSGEGTFAWSTNYSQIAAYNATPAEEAGRYLSLTERNTILSGAGIPTSPE